MTNVFAGNLDITVTERQLRELFATHGTVETITIVKDRETGEPRGIPFVEMTPAIEAQGAISALAGTMLNGHPINMNEARPKIQCAILTEEIIGDTGCKLRTRQLSLDRFSVCNEMRSL